MTHQRNPFPFDLDEEPPAPAEAQRVNPWQIVVAVAVLAAVSWLIR